MKVSEILTDESKWTKGSSAKNADDQEVMIKSPSACKWCLYGAITLAYDDAEEIVARTQKALSDTAIGCWNDAPERTFAEVRALVEKLNI